MATKHRTRVPKYRLQKPSGQAVVTLNGRDHYLGKYRTEASRAEYQRLIAEYLSGSTLDKPAGRRPAATGLTVSTLCERYIAYLEARFPDSWQKNNLDKMKLAQKPLKRIYGHTEASSFGPKALKVVREDMINQGLSRGLINASVSCIKRMFAWAVSEEPVPPSIHHAMQAVEGQAWTRVNPTQSPPGPGRPPLLHLRHIRWASPGQGVQPGGEKRRGPAAVHAAMPQPRVFCRNNEPQ